MNTSALRKLGSNYGEPEYVTTYVLRAYLGTEYLTSTRFAKIDYLSIIISLPVIATTMLSCTPRTLPKVSTIPHLNLPISLSC